VPAVLVAGSAVLGLLVGSFVNVVAYRVPRGESVVRPRSRCPACGHQIRARDNLPVLGWLLLRGRCRDCRAPVSPRYPLVELLTAAVYALLAAALGPVPALPAFLVLGAVGAALAVIDLDVKRLPDVLTLPTYVVGLVLLGAAALWQHDLGALLRALAGMVALFAFYLLLVLVYPAGMGLGDVKLAGVLGLYLGWLGYGVLVVGAFLGFLLGALAGVGLLLAGRAHRRTAIPFGPFMLLGALLAVVTGQRLVDLYLAALS